MDERFGVRRLELTHDVLTGVVRASRDTRHERETREKAEIERREAEAREAQARRQLWNRWMAALFGCLTTVAIGGRGLGSHQPERCGGSQTRGPASAGRRQLLGGVG